MSYRTMRCVHCMLLHDFLAGYKQGSFAFATNTNIPISCIKIQVIFIPMT